MKRKTFLIFILCFMVLTLSVPFFSVSVLGATFSYSWDYKMPTYAPFDNYAMFECKNSSAQTVRVIYDNRLTFELSRVGNYTYFYLKNETNETLKYIRYVRSVDGNITYNVGSLSAGASVGQYWFIASNTFLKSFVSNVGVIYEGDVIEGAPYQDPYKCPVGILGHVGYFTEKFVTVMQGYQGSSGSQRLSYLYLNYASQNADISTEYVSGSGLYLYIKNSFYIQGTVETQQGANTNDPSILYHYFLNFNGEPIRVMWLTTDREETSISHRVQYSNVNIYNEFGNEIYTADLNTGELDSSVENNKETVDDLDSTIDDLIQNEEQFKPNTNDVQNIFNSNTVITSPVYLSFSNYWKNLIEGNSILYTVIICTVSFMIVRFCLFGGT